MRHWLWSAPVVGGFAAWGASGAAVALLGIGLPFVLGQIVAAIGAGLAIHFLARPGAK